MNGAFVGGPTTFPHKSKMADGGHIEFRLDANISVLDEDNADSWYKDATRAYYRDNNCKTAFSL